jgi:hypothetical protein
MMDGEMSQHALDMERFRSVNVSNPISTMLGRPLVDVMHILGREFPSISALVIHDDGFRGSIGPANGRYVAAEYAQLAMSRPVGESMTMWRDCSHRKFWQINYIRVHHGVALLAFLRSKRCLIADIGRISECLGYLANAPR